HYFVDSFFVEDASPEPIIRINEFELSTTMPYEQYQWMRDGNSIPGATEATFMVTENGDYQVIVTNAAGCTDTSATYPVNNSSIEGLADASISIFPNPAEEVVYIKSPIMLNLKIYNIEGRLLLERENSNELSLSDLANGIYLIQLYDQRGRLMKTEK